MDGSDRSTFSKKRKLWWLDRDDHHCQAPFEHQCDSEHPLQVHHLLPHAYLHFVAPGIDPDYPLNALTLCRTAHEMIHPDVIFARENYNRDNESFDRLRRIRTKLMEDHQVYWNDTWDRSMMVIALQRTQEYERKHPFPKYHKRKKT